MNDWNLYSFELLVCAFLIDWFFKEYPNRFHPVYYIGQLISLSEKIFFKEKKYFDLIFGVVIAVILPFFLAFMFYKAQNTLNHLTVIWIIIEIYFLKSTFAFKGLIAEGNKQYDYLQENDLDSAKSNLNALCSRDSSQFSEKEISEATVSSLSENLSDSFVAPLFYYVIFGTSGAIFYRVVNTLDAMIGYKNKYRYFGKASARLDDILNYFPARITSFFILLSSLFTQKTYFWSGLKTLLLDRYKTDSPNGGWPMSAMAGILKVKLEKKDKYILGERFRPCVKEDIKTSATITSASGILYFGILISLFVGKYFL